MKKLVLLGGLLMCGLLIAGPAMAVDCSSISTLSQLLSGGCTIQDKVFSNFSYAPINAIMDPATNIKASSVFSMPGPGEDEHGWTFTNNNGRWAAGFVLSYTISVAPGFPNVTIFSSLDQVLDGSIGTPLPSVSDVQSGAGTLVVNNSSTGAATQQIFYSPVTSITTTSTASVGANGLAQYSQDWFEFTTVPEPSMLLLLGVGLVGVAGFRRKFKK